MATLGETLAKKSLAGRTTTAVQKAAILEKAPLTSQEKTRMSTRQPGTIMVGGQTFTISSGGRSSSGRSKPSVVKPNGPLNVSSTQRTELSRQTAKVGNQNVKLSDFGKDRGGRTSVLRRRDGTLEFSVGNRVVKEISPEGKTRVRIGVATPGERRRGKAASSINKITVSVLVDQRSKEARTQQRKFISAAEFFLDPAFRKQSIDPRQIKNRTIIPIIKDGLLWGYTDKAAEVTIGFSKPLTKKQAKDFVLKIESQRQTPTKIVPKSARRNRVEVNGNFFLARTSKEKEFLEFVKESITIQNRFRQEFLDDIDKRNLTIRDTDKWHRKALKGAGLGFAGLKNLPKQTNLFIRWIKAEALSKQTTKSLKKEGLTIASKQAKAGEARGRQRRLKATPGALVTGLAAFNPVKPENWFTVASFIFSAPASVKPTRNLIGKFKKNYIPSAKNTNAFKILANKQLNVMKTAKSLVQKEIRAGNSKALNKVLLSRIIKTEKTLQKGFNKATKALNNPNVLKLNDFNPLVESVELIKKFGTKQFVTHATAARVGKLFGQRFKFLKPIRNILSEVEKASGKAKRSLKPKGAINQALVSFVRKRNGVIGGSQAQNLFVPLGLRRLAKDFDILIKNPGKAAVDFVKVIKRIKPKADVRLIKTPNAFKIVMNKKEVVDFVDINLRKNLKFVKVGKDRVLSPESLATGKVSAIKDIKFFKRKTKDVKDLRRLTGDFFGQKKFLNKVKAAPDEFKIVARPQNMGAGRIQFGETQFFWDFEAPTSYAYNALGVRLLPQKIITALNKLKIPKGFRSPGNKVLNPIAQAFVKKINSQKFIKSNAKVTIIQMETRISSLPKSLLNRVKKASLSSIKEQNKLRVDLAKWIKKKENFKKVMGGSRTLSKGFGEREVVTPAGASLFKKGLKKSFDKETNSFIDVVEVAFERSKKKNLLSSKSTVGNNINRLRLADFKQLKTNFFTPADFLKVRKFKKALIRAEKLSQGEYQNIVTLTIKMLKSKKARKGLTSLSKKENKMINVLREANRKKLIRIRSPSLRSAISLVGARKRIVVKGRKVTKPRAVKRDVKTRRTATKKRATDRPRLTTRKTTRKTTPRATARTTTRVKPRTKPRAKPTQRAKTKKRTPKKIIIKPKTKKQKVFPGYFAFAFDRGKKVKLNNQPLSKVNANALAARATEGSTSATGFIRGTNKKAKPKKQDTFLTTNKKKFKLGSQKKRKGDFITEKNKFRINTVGEKKGITAKGWAASRNKRLANLRKARAIKKKKSKGVRK